MNASPRLYLLDASSFIYRAYYGIRDLATPGGLRTNAVFGFTKMLLDLLQEHRPDYLAVVLDRPREETFRRELYPEYKANRDATPEDLISQFPYINKIVKALNIPAIEAPGFEADDVIATLARRYAAEGILITVVSGDKDLLQIVDERISLLDTMKEQRFGPLEVHGRFGVPADRVADVLGLAGDPADNIPGVPGIGEKTAAELVQRFGSLEEVLKWKHLVSGKKRRESLQTYAEQARLSKTLATVRYDVPLEYTLSDLLRQLPNLPELLPLLHELEFATLATAFTPPPAGIVEIYSDGSGRDTGPGGYGVILRFGDAEKELSGFEPSSTSQRMELIAAIRGLEALTTPKRVHLYSDSQYLVRGMSEWLPGWIRNGRLDTPGALINQDLWQQLSTLAGKHRIVWNWVRGHAGHPFNERCDRLARKAVAAECKKRTLPEAERIVEEPEKITSIIHPPPALRVDSDFEVEEDGQLRLY